jgi:BMFP domain-containing protein YqiC
MSVSASSVEELARRVAAELPAAIGGLRQEIEAQLRAALQRHCSQLGLVTQEEFRVQSRLLEQTRARVGELEALLTRN